MAPKKAGEKKAGGEKKAKGGEKKSGGGDKAEGGAKVNSIQTRLRQVQGLCCRERALLRQQPRSMLGIFYVRNTVGQRRH